MTYKRVFTNTQPKFALLLSIILTFSFLFPMSSGKANSSAENIALYKSYTSSIAADTNYPDSGHDLTDGSYGTTEPGDAAWQARNTSEKYHFVINLEDYSNIEELHASFLDRHDSGISLPNNVRFFVSDDNITFDEIGNINKKSINKVEINPYDESIYTAKFSLKDLNNVTANFVKVEVEGNGWTFIDEIEIYGYETVKEGDVDDSIKIEPPANVNVVNTTYSTVTLTWNLNDEATKYLIYENNKLIAETEKAEHTVGNLTAGTIYSFEVKAKDAKNNISESSDSVTATTKEINIPTGNPTFQGTFVQPDLLDSWSAEQWDQEFQYMSEVGINQLFIQWVADSKNHTAIYDTQVEGFTQNTSSDLVEKALAQADHYNSEIYIGLILNEDWFIKYANDQAWLDNERDLVKSFVDEIWAKYGSHKAFAGWYLSFEVDNWNLPTEKEWDRLAHYYEDVITHIKGYSPNKPVVISPFFNPDGGLDLNGWKAMWEYILDIAPIDIIALQDGVGAGHAIVDTLPEWFLATLEAIEQSNTDTKLWADTETFTLDFKPMNVKHIVEHMKEVHPFVSNFISFSFNHYMSPQQVDPLYYQAYKDYVETGRLDEVAPSIPQILTTEVEGSTTVTIKWAPSEDDSGIAGYYIYRDGHRVQVLYGNVTSFTDILLQPETAYRYSVQSFDATGNISDYSEEQTVTTLASKDFPINFAYNKSYESSVPAHDNYPDGNQKLTDGIYGGVAYDHEAWQGRHTEKEFEFVIDLEEKEEIKEFRANFLQDLSLYIFLPRSVTYYVSDDNENFNEIGIVQRPAVGEENQAKSFILTELEDVSGRYVKVKITPATAWTFIDEIEVRGLKSDSSTGPNGKDKDGGKNDDTNKVNDEEKNTKGKNEEDGRQDKDPLTKPIKEDDNELRENDDLIVSTQSNDKQLPNTATSYYTIVLVGMILILCSGILLYLIKGRHKLTN